MSTLKVLIIVKLCKVKKNYSKYPCETHGWLIYSFQPAMSLDEQVAKVNLKLAWTRAVVDYNIWSI